MTRGIHIVNLRTVLCLPCEFDRLISHIVSLVNISIRIFISFVLTCQWRVPVLSVSTIIGIRSSTFVIFNSLGPLRHSVSPHGKFSILEVIPLCGLVPPPVRPSLGRLIYRFELEKDYTVDTKDDVILTLVCS